MGQIPAVKHEIPAVIERRHILPTTTYMYINSVCELCTCIWEGCVDKKVHHHMTPMMLNTATSKSLSERKTSRRRASVLGRCWRIEMMRNEEPITESSDVMAVA